MIRKLFAASLVFLFLYPATECFPAADSGSGEFNAKILLERHIEERLRSALTEITGTDKVIVVVNADVDTSRQRAVSGRKGVLTRKEDTNALVLPGVPAKKEIGKSSTQTAELNLPDAQGAGMVNIRRITVTVILDKSVPAAVMDVVREIANDIIDFNPNRGDRVEIKQLGIKKVNFHFSSFLYPPHLYWVILIITGGFFLLAASLFLMNPFIKLSGSGQNVKVDVLKDAAADILSQPSGEKATDARTAVDLGGEREAVERTFAPFSFIKEKHLRDLSFLLDKVSILDTAIVVNYIDTELALKLLDYFPEEKQAEITLCLGGIEEISPEKIKILEEKIKEKLGYLIGGEDKIANILGLVSDEVRDKVFDLLEIKDADAAARLKNKVKDFETIMRELPSQGIHVLYRQMDHTLFAQILKSSPEDIQKKVLDTLSAGGAEMLKQEMELSRPLSHTRLKKEKHNIILIIRRMIREGSLEVEGS